MLADYRKFLIEELKLLSNASHHAYSFGQANMAKRAIEQLDAETGGSIVLELSPQDAEAIREALLTLRGAGPVDAALERLETRLTEAIERPADLPMPPAPNEFPTV